jgi:hypothetical protein
MELAYLATEDPLHPDATKVRRLCREMSASLRTQVKKAMNQFGNRMRFGSICY